MSDTNAGFGTRRDGTEWRLISRSARFLFLLLLVALVATSCRVSADDLSVSRTTVTGAAVGNSPGDGGLPVLGPIPNSSHWHAAYVVRICDDVLPPFDSELDPLGIHSHSDGVMHVHPFFDESGYESATIGLFADAMEFQISDGELTLPGGGTWRDGDLCDGVPGRVFIDRWRDPNPESPVERIFSDLANVRYLADGELYQIAFAPEDSFPVVPPASANLGEYSNLAPPPEPWVSLDAAATSDQVFLWEVASVSVEPCSSQQMPEVVLYGSVRCFGLVGDGLPAASIFSEAKAVLFNRQPAVEVMMQPELQTRIAEHFSRSQDPLALAIEVDGFVVTAPQLVRPPTSDRLVISGGMSVETAKGLAELLNS